MATRVIHSMGLLIRATGERSHAAYGSPEPRLNSSRARGGSSCRGAGEAQRLRAEKWKGISSAWHVSPKLSSWWRSLGALQRRHPRSESHRRLLDSCCSFSLIVRCLARSNVVSELEGKDTDPSIEQSADATVDAAEHILEQADLYISSDSSITGLKLCMPLPTCRHSGSFEGSEVDGEQPKAFEK